MNGTPVHFFPSGIVTIQSCTWLRHGSQKAIFMLFFLKESGVLQGCLLLPEFGWEARMSESESFFILHVRSMDHLHVRAAKKKIRQVSLHPRLKPFPPATSSRCMKAFVNSTNVAESACTQRHPARDSISHGESYLQIFQSPPPSPLNAASKVR